MSWHMLMGWEWAGVIKDENHQLILLSLIRAVQFGGSWTALLTSASLSGRQARSIRNQLMPSMIISKRISGSFYSQCESVHEWTFGRHLLHSTVGVTVVSLIPVIASNPYAAELQMGITSCFHIWCARSQIYSPCHYFWESEVSTWLIKCWLCHKKCTINYNVFTRCILRSRLPLFWQLWDSTTLPACQMKCWD